MVCAVALAATSELYDLPFAPKCSSFDILLVGSRLNDLTDRSRKLSEDASASAPPHGVAYS